MISVALLFLVMSGVTQTPAPRELESLSRLARVRPVGGASVAIVGAPGSREPVRTGGYLARASFAAIRRRRFDRMGAPPRPVRIETIAAFGDIRIEVAAGWSETLTVRGAARHRRVGERLDVV